MDIRQQAVTGVIPPSVAEARIREAWPSVASFPAIASLGQMLTRSILLAPLAWIVMGGIYFGKILPLFMRRYTLTNRRIMIRAGWSGKPVQEVSLAEIDEVRLVTDGNTEFFRAANLEIVGGGKVLLTLAGVPDPESFRHAIINSRNAWVPGKAKTMAFIPASAVK
jgi:hypothetical protein